MSDAKNAAEPGTPAAWGGRALKWVGAVTAVVSLILGIQQLTLRVRDSMARSREAANQIEIARGQASRSAFPDAWKSLDRAEALGSSEAVNTARVDVALAWLEDAHPGPGRPFSTITDPVAPALDRALLTAQGPRRADIVAHMGWAAFLRMRDGLASDPAARYQEALKVDPKNPYANAMLGHWLMWEGGGIDPPRQRFDTALTNSSGTIHLFARRLQLAALMNKHNDDGDAELIRVVSEMRQKQEPLDATVADGVYWIYTLRWGPNAGLVSSTVAVSDADLVATYEWVLAASASGQRAAGVSGYVRAMLQAKAGQSAVAIATFQGLQNADTPPSVRDAAQREALRLGGRITPFRPERRR